MYNEFYLPFSVTGMSPLSPYLNVDPRYLVQVSFCNTTDNVTFQKHNSVVKVSLMNSQTYERALEA